MHNQTLQAPNNSPVQDQVSPQRLLVMDVDSTLIDEEVIDLIGEASGKGEHIADITNRAMRGELDFRQALAERVRLLQGVPVSVLDDVFNAVHFTNGALDMIATAHDRGWTVGVVSGGFHEIVDRLVALAGIDHAIANTLETKDGFLTGRTLGEVVTKETKLRALQSWADEDGVDMADTVAIGDGANDIPMILAAGTSIAFCAKPAVRQAAPHALNVRDLRPVISIIDSVWQNNQQ
ncbi:MAG: phosphoserine phosphatase SerB [Bifidobacterium sp.]|uniref:phosphoserine phosphatase n=2 Tax=Bifidobacterium TaxID=1678 RepID=A0AB39U4S9_9BIFI